MPNLQAFNAATSQNSANAAVEVQYPNDLFSTAVPQPYIYFIVRDSVWKSNQIKSHLWLYMPPEIRVNYGSQWEDIQMNLYQYKDLGTDVSNVVTGMIGEFKAGVNSGSLNIKGIMSALKPLAAMAGRGVANHFDGSAAGGSFGNQLEQIYGRTVNPHMALMFKGINFREFSLSFRLMARNAEESDSIRDLIKEFKKAMHPGLDNAEGWGTRYWLYPDNFDIYLYTPTPQGDKGYMFNIANSVLIDMSVDYGGSGVPSFFLDTGAPVDIQLTLHFKEQTVLTKDNIEKGY